MSVLQRKAQAGKRVHQVRSMTVPKSLRVGLAKVADETLGMALSVIGITQEKCSGDALADKVEPDALHILLDGPRGAIGGAVLDPSLVSALVQQQTTGCVVAQHPGDRRLTATDAALCAPFIDALFARANGLLETQQDKDLLACFRFGARMDSARLFDLALGEPDYHLTRLTIDVAAGTYQSNMTLILPMSLAQEVPVSPESSNGAVSCHKAFEATAMGLRAELSAVLCRVKLPLSQLSKLVPGDTLDVPAEAFDDVEVISIEGRKIAKGVMGQMDGHRAVMIRDPATKPERVAPGDELQAGRSGAARAATLPDLPDVGAPAEIEPMVRANASEPLQDLPELPSPSDGLSGNWGTALQDEADLPELPDLTDLDDDLPDIDDLPKLNIA